MPPTILVVDDQDVSRRVAYRILREADYRVLEAESGEEALATLRHTQERVDLVLLDVVMPEIDGVELARRILEEWPDTRILFMSAHPTEIVAQRGIDFRHAFFLIKPYTRREALARVKEALEHPQSLPEESRHDQP